MRVVLILLISLFLTSCSNDKKVKPDVSLNDTLVLTAIDSIEQKRQEWFRNNLIPKHELLISFSCSPPTKKENTNHLKEFREIRGSENKISEIETTRFADSLIVTFYKRIKRECGIRGNISINKDTVRLLFQDICSPIDRPTKRGEFYKFKYVIKSATELNGKTFKPEEGVLLKN